MGAATPQQVANRLRCLLFSAVQTGAQDPVTMQAAESIAACFDTTIDGLCRMLHQWSKNEGCNGNRFYSDDMASFIWSEFTRFQRADAAFLLLSGRGFMEWFSGMDWGVDPERTQQ